MTKKEFAKIVRDTRKSLGLTQGAFSDLLGVNWITIWRWEKEREAPNKVIMGLWVDKIKNLKEPT